MSTPGDEIDHYLARLFPISRCITGNGNRITLEILREILPLNIAEYPSGTRVYDWEIPSEWNIYGAYIKDNDGNKLVDFALSNIHVMGYSEAVNARMTFAELDEHLIHDPRLPAEAIPYRTSYYQKKWGFCVSRNQYQTIKQAKGPFAVCIDATHSNGALTVGELVIPGKSHKEFLISTYICHPSLANDNLSGVVLTAFLGRELLRKSLNFSYRILFVPETIGAIAYCCANEEVMERIDSGVVVTCVGGPGDFSYKKSFDAGHVINAITEDVLRARGGGHVYDFDIHGSDERQYSSHKFRINTVSIFRDKYYEYPYYHSSLDNLDFVLSENILKSLDAYLALIDVVDKNIVFQNMNPGCEVMLSKHDLYPPTGGGLLPGKSGKSELDMILWLLFHCDGSRDLYGISREIGCPIDELYRIAIMLEEKDILSRQS